jgi:hypothetical protein
MLQKTVERKAKVIKTLLEREGIKVKTKRFGDVVKLTVLIVWMYIFDPMWAGRISS